MLQPQGYRARITDALVEEYLKVFGIVQIEGAKYCGKTWTALSFAQSAVNLDDPLEAEHAAIDPAYLTVGKRPHLIDEWQLMPSVRDRLRRIVDTSAQSQGSFILTGSSIPPATSFSHSGAGRVGRITMRPMSLFESGVSSGKISLRNLFSGEFITMHQETTIQDVAQWVCRGGWPAFLEGNLNASRIFCKEYLKALFLDNTRRYNLSSQMAQRIFYSLARNNTQAPSIETLASDCAAGELAHKDQKPARGTVDKYLSFYKDLFVLETLPAWGVGLRNKKRLRSKEKLYLVDPSLAVATLQTNEVELQNDMQTLGMLFENLCIRDLKIYAQTQADLAGGELFYYRDDYFEVDTILRLPNGQWGAFEIKLSETKAKEGAKNLLRLKELVQKNTASQIPQPSFLCVLVGAGSGAYKEEDGVKVVPLALLRD